MTVQKSTVRNWPLQINLLYGSKHSPKNHNSPISLLKVQQALKFSFNKSIFDRINQGFELELPRLDLANVGLTSLYRRFHLGG